MLKPNKRQNDSDGWVIHSLHFQSMPNRNWCLIIGRSSQMKHQGDCASSKRLFGQHPHKSSNSMHFLTPAKWRHSLHERIIHCYLDAVLHHHDNHTRASVQFSPGLSANDSLIHHEALKGQWTLSTIIIITVKYSNKEHSRWKNKE